MGSQQRHVRLLLSRDELSCLLSVGDGVLWAAQRPFRSERAPRAVEGATIRGRTLGSDGGIALLRMSDANLRILDLAVAVLFGAEVTTTWVTVRSVRRSALSWTSRLTCRTARRSSSRRSMTATVSMLRTARSSTRPSGGQRRSLTQARASTPMSALRLFFEGVPALDIANARYGLVSSEDIKGETSWCVVPKSAQKRDKLLAAGWRLVTVC